MPQCVSKCTQCPAQCGFGSSSAQEGSGRVLVLLVPGATSPALTLLAGLSCPTPCSSLRGQHRLREPQEGTEPEPGLLSPGSRALPPKCFHPCQDLEAALSTLLQYKESCPGQGMDPGGL